MDRKIGLVIQGALMSVGRSGGALHESPEELHKEGKVIYFNSRDNINRLIREFGHLFQEVVVSVFDNQLKPGENFPGAKIVSAPDPGGIKQSASYKDNNKFRQFISTLNGIKELEKSGVQYVVKARTDQYVDLEEILKSFFEERIKYPNPKAIGVTVSHPPTFLLHDLYFCAETEVLKEFCEAILSYDRFEFISSVHREMVLKHAYFSYSQEIGVPESAYFPINPPDGVNRHTRKIFDYMFKNVYFDLHSDIFYGTVWRGDFYERDHVKRLVNKADPSRFKIDLPLLISTDWRRYYHFLKETTGREISILDRLIIAAGMAGWKLWNLIRKVVRYFL